MGVRVLLRSTFESEPEALHEATRVLAITDGACGTWPSPGHRTSPRGDPEPAQAGA
jgi:hypothetical protein